MRNFKHVFIGNDSYMLTLLSYSGNTIDKSLLTKRANFGEQKTCLTENEIKGDGSEATSVICQ